MKVFNLNILKFEIASESHLDPLEGVAIWALRVDFRSPKVDFALCLSTLGLKESIVEIWELLFLLKESIFGLLYSILGLLN